MSENQSLESLVFQALGQGVQTLQSLRVGESDLGSHLTLETMALLIQYSRGHSS